MLVKKVSLDRDAEILRIIQGSPGILRQKIVGMVGISRAQMTSHDKRIGDKVFRQKTRGGEYKYFSAEYAAEHNTPAQDSFNGIGSLEDVVSGHFMARVKQIDSLWITGRG